MEIDTEKLKELSIRLGAIKNDIDALSGSDDVEDSEDDGGEEDVLDTQDENTPQNHKSEYTTGEAQKKSRASKDTSLDKAAGKRDPKKVGLMIAFLKGKKK